MQEQLTNINVDPLTIAVAVGLLVIFIAVLLVMLVLRRTGQGDDRLKEQLAVLVENQTKMQGAFELLQTNAQTGNSDLKRNLEERLDAFGKRMGDSLGETREKTHENLKSLGERLAVIDRAQKNIEALGHEVSGLQSILSNKQSRGAFGEMRMQDMVEDSLPPGAYEFQKSLSNAKRVDCLIHLPNGAEGIAVDAKFPLESWRNLQDAPDDVFRKQAAAALRTDIKKHIKDIAAKYLLPGETTDTALLFLPSEAIYADLHAHFPELIQLAFTTKVMIVSPTTFMATLLTISSLMKDARMREQAHLIQREVGLMMKDVQLLEDRATKLDRHFKLTEKDISDLLTSTSRIGKRAGKISDVDVEPQSLEADAKPPMVLVKGKPS